jgi:thiosulfate/3-mercaptopyruvate sulfurtransferase
MVSAFVGLVLATQLTTAPGLIEAASLREALDTEAGRVTVLDARAARDYARGHVPGAVHIDWTDYRDGWCRTGRVPDDLSALAARLGALGIDEARPVVVYGDARNGWGEEGRIAWMLHYLGHREVRVLDGGVAAWRAVGGTLERSRVRAPAGRFTARPVATVRASIDEVAVAAGLAPMPTGSTLQRPVLLDVRPRDEWDGARHYREPRAGHIPGAVRVHWRDLLDDAGHLKPRETLLPLLAQRGVTADRTIVVYCTGGVRSAEAFWMLRALGFADVRNYDGSWYEWAFDRRRPAVIGGPDDGTASGRDQPSP